MPTCPGHDVHSWSSPLRACDACQCGDRVIVETISTGTVDGPGTVVSWRSVPRQPTDAEEGE